MSERHFDVCVVGGGPAGSATATRLAKLGHSVCVLERLIFPRPHVGESLTRGINPIFDVLGLAELEGNGFSRSGDSLIRWSDARVEQFGPGARARGLLVDRGKFDAALLEAAKTSGVRVFQPARITKAERNALGWRSEVVGKEGLEQIVSKFLVDAAGRQGFLPRKRRSVSARTVALCGYISSEECPRATLVEAVQDGWCWGAAIPGGRFSTMIFLDPDTLRAERRNGLESIWRSRLAKTELFSSFSGSQLIGKLIVCDATTYFVENPVEAKCFRVGEACFALDPLSSTGVEKAMQSGLVGATALHTMLAHPDRMELCARFYCDRHNETVSSHAAWSSEFYGKVRRFEELPFWRKRADGHENNRVAEEKVTTAPSAVVPTLMSKIRVSAKTELVEQGCIVGDEICSRPALVHPELRRPVAFLGGVEIGTLLDMVRWSTDLGRLLQLWSNRMSPGQVARIASWLLSKKILETIP